MQSLTLSETIDRFFTARQAARYSPNTLRDYQNTYKKFGSFLGTDLPISKINSTHITQFMASEEVMAVSKKTALNYHTGLSSLWNWAIENSLVEKNVVRTVKPPSPEKREIIPYSRAEVLKLIQVSRSGRNSLRDEAIVLTLLDTGMRASEICELKIKDLNKIERRLLIFGKGDKERQVKICPRTITSIYDYLVTRRISYINKTRNLPIFITIQSKKMNRNTIGQIMDRLQDRSGVTNVYAHRFRHTFAINFLRNGGTIYTLQKLLGHTTLDMVKRYLQIAQLDIDRDHERASPVSNWGI